MALFDVLEILPLVLLSLLGVSALVPAAVYIVSAWRDRQQGRDDPRLGVVSVFGYLAYLGFTMTSLSLTALLVMVFEGRGGAEAIKVPIAVLLSGAIVVAATFLPLRALLRGAPSRPGRLYLGLFAFTSALLAIVAVTGFLTSLITESRVTTWLAVLLIQGPLAVAGAVTIARRSPSTPS